MVSEPYGGKLVNRVLTGSMRERRIEEAYEMAKFSLDNSARFDVEKIAIGAFSPLEGFMGREDYEKVLYEGKLANGLSWTIPIVFSPGEEQNGIIVKELKEGDDVGIFHEGKPVAILRLEEKFSYDKKEMAQQVYGTINMKHPNVAKLYTNFGEILLAGKIDYIDDLKSSLVEHELTPKETREIFEKKGWRTIAAYQTRNPPHVAHEYIQRCALEMVDGILIHPVVGELKGDDFPPEATVEAYRFLIDNYYHQDRVVLSPLAIAMRYAGPKAAIFLAIIRKNYGCTHFIVGRDIAGVGNYYDPYGSHKIFKDIDIGIEPILFRESFYCKRCTRVATDKTCGHRVEDHVKISMTEIRNMLSRGQTPPAEAIRPEIANILMKYVNRGDGHV